jgi:hypothetical protein
MSEARWAIHFAWGRPPYALDLPEVVVGRADSCTLQIQDDHAADEHARFVVDDDEQVWLEDLGSAGGTLINGRAIGGRTALADGDFVQIGNAVLTLRASHTTMRQVRIGPEELTQTHDLRTVMMEAPLLPSVTVAAPRELQATLEIKTSDVVASLPRDPPPAPEPLPMAPTTIAMAAVSPRESGAHASSAAAMTTLMGVGPTELPSAPTMMGAAPLPPEPLPAAATRIGEAPRHRGHTQTDLTPLPAPVPPLPSIPDLGPMVRQTSAAEPTQAATVPARSNVETLPVGATINSLQTQQLAAADPHGLGYEKISRPQDVPPEVTALPEQRTRIGVRPAEPTHAPQTPQTPDTTQTTAPAEAATPPRGTAPYVAPTKGPFGSFSRALDFFSQMRELARAEPALRRPIVTNLMIATPIMLGVSALLLVLRSASATYLVMCLGTAALYFVDYFMNAVTASLIHDYVHTGRVDAAAARDRARRATSGILVFAAASALLDVAATYARERRDPLSRILLRVLHAVWTTATYAIMPAMVLEGLSFGAALSRSKKLMDQDPTGVGAGVVALSLVTYFIGAIVFPLAFFLSRLGAHLHVIVGMVLFFATVNIYWAVTGWLKIAYSTCFYLWAKKCEAAGSADPALAPVPLRHALDAG